MKAIIIRILTITVTFIIISGQAQAIRESRPTSVDPRLRVISYNPNDVFKFIGHYGYQSNIEFSEGEIVENITMGDTVAWQIVPAGNRVFLKPMEPNATTNMTLLTNKRTYYFELHADEAKDISDSNIAFNVRFIYPDENDTNSAIMSFATSDNGIEFANKEKLNYKYTISGAELVAPIKIFDDGEFTYFEFRDKNAEIPAFFLVNSAGREEIINYRVKGNYVIVERVASRYTLRSGRDIVCVFNETMLLR